MGSGVPSTSEPCPSHSQSNARPDIAQGLPLAEARISTLPNCAPGHFLAKTSAASRSGTSTTKYPPEGFFRFSKGIVLDTLIASDLSYSCCGARALKPIRVNKDACLLMCADVSAIDFLALRSILFGHFGKIIGLLMEQVCTSQGCVLGLNS